MTFEPLDPPYLHRDLLCGGDGGVSFDGGRMSHAIRMTPEAFNAHQLRVKGPPAASPPPASALKAEHGAGGARPTNKEKEQITQSNIEAIMEFDIEKAGLPKAERNYIFYPGRKWELDFAWPELKLAVSVQGNAHRIKTRFYADMEKRAELILRGWVHLEVSGPNIRDGSAIGWLQELYTRQVNGVTIAPEAIMK